MNPNKMPAQQRDPKTGRWLPKQKADAKRFRPTLGMIDQLADDLEEAIKMVRWSRQRMLYLESLISASDVREREALLRHEIEELRRERDEARALYSAFLRRVNVLPHGCSLNFIEPGRHD